MAEGNKAEVEKTTEIKDNLYCPSCSYRPKTKVSLARGEQGVYFSKATGYYDCGFGFNSCAVVESLNQGLRLGERVKALEQRMEDMKE